MALLHTCYVIPLFTFFEFFAYYSIPYIQKKAVETFYHETLKLVSHTQKRRDFISECQLLKIGCFLNMLAVLDALKNMKASLSNDLSMYRRFGPKNMLLSIVFLLKTYQSCLHLFQ